MVHYNHYQTTNPYFFHVTPCRLETSFWENPARGTHTDGPSSSTKPPLFVGRPVPWQTVRWEGGWWKKNSPELIKMDPIPSMYGIFSYIYHKNQPNVDKYSIHGSYGKWIEFPGIFSGANQTFTCYFINTFSIPVGRFQHFNPWKKHMLEPTNQPTNKKQTTNNKQQIGENRNPRDPG